MKLREFNKLTRTWVDHKTGLFDKEKIKIASDKEKHEVFLFLIRKRKPVISLLKTPLTDISWIHCMGYLYAGDNGHFQFYCLSEHIQGQMRRCELSN